jgi:predicted ATP-grasp superfamily ATP-dependent carboligase
VIRKPPVINPNAKRILISGGGMTKALQLARSLAMSGHYIVLTEEYSFTAHRFSRYVSRFCLSADTKNHAIYMPSIIDIVQREKIDIFVPVSHSWNECADSLVKQALLPFNCETVHGELEQLQMLSDKYEFVTQARSFGLAVPKTYKITDPKQVLDFDFSKEKCQFILKSILDNNLTRWDPIKLPCQTRQQTIDYLNALIINDEYPWIMQEFIPGKEYCTHGAVRNGELRLYACCESSSWLLRYKHIENKPMILEWVQEFCSKANLTGQASFDFIESNENGRVYAIECNPRTHTAVTTFYNHPRVAEAYLDKTQLPNGPIQPYTNARQTYWLYHELWNLLKVRRIDDLLRQLQRLLNGKEAIYSTDDILPFFFQYTIHMPCVLISNLLIPMDYKKVDCNLGLLL